MSELNIQPTFPLLLLFCFRNSDGKCNSFTEKLYKLDKQRGSLLKKVEYLFCNFFFKLKATENI